MRHPWCVAGYRSTHGELSRWVIQVTQHTSQAWYTGTFRNRASLTLLSHAPTSRLHEPRGCNGRVGVRYTVPRPSAKGPVRPCLSNSPCPLGHLLVAWTVNTFVSYLSKLQTLGWKTHLTFVNNTATTDATNVPKTKTRNTRASQDALQHRTRPPSCSSREFSSPDSTTSYFSFSFIFYLLF